MNMARIESHPGLFGNPYMDTKSKTHEANPQKGFVVQINASENFGLKHRVQWLRREQKRDQKLEARLPQRLKVIADEHHLEAVYLATSLASYSSIICLSGSGQRSAVASLRRAVRFAPGQCSISIS